MGVLRFFPLVSGGIDCGIFIQTSFGLEEAKKRTGSKLWSIHDHCSMSQVTNIMLDVDLSMMFPNARNLLYNINM